MVVEDVQNRQGPQSQLLSLSYFHLVRCQDPQLFAGHWFTSILCEKNASLIPNVHHLGILCDEPKSFLLWFQLWSTHLRYLLACLFFPLPIHCCPILRWECKVEGEVWPCTWPEGIDHGGSITLPEALQRLHPPQPHPSLTLAHTSPAGILVVSHHALELGRQS